MLIDTALMCIFLVCSCIPKPQQLLQCSCWEVCGRDARHKRILACREGIWAASTACLYRLCRGATNKQCTTKLREANSVNDCILS